MKERIYWIDWMKTVICMVRRPKASTISAILADESTLRVLDVPIGTREYKKIPTHYYICRIYDFIKKH